MTHPRKVLAATAALVVVAMSAACTPSPTATVIPTVASSSPTPSSTPSATYGPNQTAAIAAVTGYYAWWNRARKNPKDPQFLELPKYMSPSAPPYGTTIGDVNTLASDGFRQVGDFGAVNVAPEQENATKITLAVCLDRTGTHLENAAGMTVDPIDGHTGATIPAAQVFTRRSYAVVTAAKGTAWIITDISGGTAPC